MKTWKRWVSAGRKPAGSPESESNRDFSLPDAPEGTRDLSLCKYY